MGLVHSVGVGGYRVAGDGCFFFLFFFLLRRYRPQQRCRISQTRDACLDAFVHFIFRTFQISTD